MFLFLLKFGKVVMGSKKENKLRLTAAHNANKMRQEMNDERSIILLDYIIANNGKKPHSELINKAYAAAVGAALDSDGTFYNAHAAFAAFLSTYIDYDIYLCLNDFSVPDTELHKPITKNNIYLKILLLPIWSKLSSI